VAKCLVLGANGFIGSHLVDSLSRAGHFVRCFDRFQTKDAIFLNKGSSNVEVFRGDFLDKTSLQKALENIDYVFHFISTTTPLTAENDPLTDIETNVKMSVELFSLCAQASVKKVIFASTGGSIYGNVDSSKPLSENLCPMPVSPYAIGKLSIEHYLRYFKRKHGLDYRVLRISNPYGPRQNTLSGQGVISIFLENIRKEMPITIYGDGSMIRDYIFISDVAEMIAGSFEKSTDSLVYNLGSGKGYSVNEVVKIIEQVTKVKPHIAHKEAPTTFVNEVVLDTTKFTDDFSITPKVNLKEGIEKTWQALKKTQ
jgi:UDP-glucose 4-epimerase